MRKQLFFLSKIKAIVFLMLLLSISNNGLFAQTPTYLGHVSATAFGSGTSGVPTLSWNIPAGKNRMMIITVTSERYHNPASSNFPSAADGTTGNVSTLVTVGTNNATNITGRAYLNPATLNTTRYSFHHNLLYLSDADGNLPTGNATFTFPNLNVPESNGDEIIVTATVFEGVKNVVDIAYEGTQIPTGTTVSSVSGTHPAVGAGLTAANVLYFGLGTSSQDSQLSFGPSTWTSPISIVLSNNGGPAPSGISNEPNGIAARVGYRTFTTASSPTLNVTKASSSTSNRGTANILGLVPYARPKVSGTVYRDNNGLTGGVNAGGTGGGVYPSTGVNTLYVNALDETATTVIATATVNASGVFTFPAGSALTEGTTYILQLSKNQGTPGQPRPVKDLPAGWALVGESSTSGPSDGYTDGFLTITVDATGTPYDDTYRFGVTPT